MSLFAQLGNTENLAHIFKGAIRIFIFDPHSLCGIDRGTAANSHDPVRLERQHRICTAHNGFYRRIRFNTVKDLNFHAGFLQISFSPVKETEALHGTAADADHCFLSFEGLQCFKGTFTVVNIAGKSKTCHFVSPVLFLSVSG